MSERVSMSEKEKGMQSSTKDAKSSEKQGERKREQEQEY